MKKGSHHSPESIAKQKAAHAGQQCHPNTRAAARLTCLTNNPMNKPENRLAAREMMKQNNPMFNQKSRDSMAAKKANVPLTQAHKDAIAEGTKIALSDPDVRARMSSSHMGMSMPQETRDKISATKKNVKKTEEHKDKLRESMQGKYDGENNPFYGKKHNAESMEKMRAPKTLEHRIALSCSRRGIPIEEFDQFIHFAPYCEKFNDELKERVRHFFGNKCVLCGKLARQNLNRSGEIQTFVVHHVYIEKMVCCESKIEQIREVRQRLPRSVARFNSPELTEEEILYIRMMVPLCRSCHGKVNGERGSLAYDKAPYRKFFTELILNKYNGKWCYTVEEFKKLKEKSV